jgi:hypothetical protein
MNAWGIFILGFFVGFIFASFLITWYEREDREDKERLETTVNKLTAELRKHGYTTKKIVALQSLKDQFKP